MDRYDIRVTPQILAEKVLSAAHAAFDAAGLDTGVLPATATVERPRVAEHGDYASNISLQVAKKAGKPTRELAEAIAGHLRQVEGIAAVDIAGPGFLNIRLDTAATSAIAGTIIETGDTYGHNDSLNGQKLNLEFVSANPTGPLHIGSVRWAAVGDALGRIIAASGAAVTTEYYVNDAGTQMDLFGVSLLAAATDKPIPEDGYQGGYVKEIADQIVAADLDIFGDPDPTIRFRDAGLALMLTEIKNSLTDFGVHFDDYFSERSLHESGAIEAAVQRLTEQGRVFEAEGALWLRTTDFGDDKDRVLKRGDGMWTYFAADCAYYLNKRQRADKAIYLLGADHHGYVGRMKAMAACFGDDTGTHQEILIGQMLNLFADGKPLRMSKRKGTITTLRDFVTALGADAGRYALARYSTDSTIDLDLDLWTRASTDNPVYYVQYAHARIASLLRNANEMGLSRGESYDATLLEHPREGDLLKQLAEFPKVVATAAELLEPHRIARYAEDLAGAYHRFYDACRVLPRGDDEFTDTGAARLWLVEATRVVLANALRLLGVTAPERM